MLPRTAIETAIIASTGRSFHIEQECSIAGGCINSAWKITGDRQRYFVKTHPGPQAEAMLAGEAVGLHALAQGIRAPTPIAHGYAAEMAFLVLEWLDLEHLGDMGHLGQALAHLHRQSAPQFGFSIDNHIGITPQINTWQADWGRFWQEQRLAPQITLARAKGFHLRADADQLLEICPVFFQGHTPTPSLIHGDLWNGNIGFLADGQPALFDPACYYGDREADLAMTELFGGFGPKLMAAYQASYPTDSGYKVRRTLYNLYHILNHLNLFGSSYLAQAETMIGQLLAQAR